jgi:hypothetical protein
MVHGRAGAPVAVSTSTPYLDWSITGSRSANATCSTPGSVRTRGSSSARLRRSRAASAATSVSWPAKRGANHLSKGEARTTVAPRNYRSHVRRSARIAQVLGVLRRLDRCQSAPVPHDKRTPPAAMPPPELLRASGATPKRP